MNAPIKTRSDGLPGLSVRRPILILVVNLLIALAGLSALFGVEVRELPNVDRPVVSVRAAFPGASPQTMDAEVTSLLEGAVARVAGISQIRSASEENSGRIRIEFEPGVDLDRAAADVREAVSRVQRELPDEVEQLTVTKSDQDADPIVSLSITSDHFDQTELTRIIERDIVPELIAIKGVADVPLFGDRQLQLRVVVDPLRVASLGLSIDEVAAGLRTARYDVPAGSFRSDDQQLLVRANASVTDPDQIEDIILRDRIRVGDVAQVYFGPEDVESYSSFNGRPVIGLGIVRQAGSNTMDISDAVSRAIERLNQRYDQLNIQITSDAATFIRGAVREVVISLTLTILIVIATIWLFLGTIRATLIPSVAIPLALIGTVSAIWLFGFSLNILTLLALVLATGLVVDDAIVVLENVQRRRNQGLGPRAGAVLGTRQVFFAVVATTAVLVSVFVPISFLPGTAGRMFREFGFVLAVAVIISSFVSLSLVPAMTARIRSGLQNTSPFRSRIERAGSAMAATYRRLLHSGLNHPLRTAIIVMAILLGSGFVYRQLPSELLPQEDRGVLIVRATGPDSVGLSYMARQSDQIEEILQPFVASGEIESLDTTVGRWDPNRVQVTARLAPWGQRDRSQRDIQVDLENRLAGIAGSRIQIRTTNSLNLWGGGGGIDVAVVGNNHDDIFVGAKLLAEAIENDLPNLSGPRIEYDPTQPQLSMQIDRQRAADLGVSLDALATILRTMVDGLEVVDLNVDDQSVPVVLEASHDAINDPTDLLGLYVRADTGRLVPLSAVVSLHEEGIAPQLDRFGQRRAIQLSANVAPTYPLASAVADIERVADEVLPDGLGLLLRGEAATLDETSRQVAMTYAIAFLVVFLVLCAQFESFASPLIITLTVPFGIAAAIYALFLTGTSVNLYSQIGLIMLIGLMAKNGILLVEFADQLRDQGRDVRSAIEKAAQVRLRPIMMTIGSTALGGIPLILSDGPGAESRAAIGWVVFGGLGLSALFTLFLTPVIYVAVARFNTNRAAEAEQLQRELEATEKAGG